MTAPVWMQPLIDAAHQSSAWNPVADDLPEDARKSAVLILFGEGSQGPDVLLIERSAHMRSHAGQPAFPGGGVDATDDGPVAAALREAQEETGLDPEGVEVVAVFDDIWVPPSGNVVTPVLAWWHTPCEVEPADVNEVAAVSRVPIAALADPDNRVQVRAPSGRLGPAFEVADMFVWGFTAGVLTRLLSVGGWEQPWDSERVVDLPPEALRLALRPRRTSSSNGGS